MALSRKHFQFFAEWCAEENISNMAISSLTDYFEDENPSFDYDRFMDAVFNKRGELGIITNNLMQEKYNVIHSTRNYAMDRWLRLDLWCCN